MMAQPSQGSGKPPWVRLPWSILFDLERLKGLRAWEIDLSTLLASFVKELRRYGLANFSIPGIALLSSASIYRLKTELILKLEELPPPAIARAPMEGPIVAMSLPLRAEYGSLTIDELLAAIRETLARDTAAIGETQPRIQSVEPEIPFSLPPLDSFLAQIDERIESLHERLLTLFERENIVSFSMLIEGLERREAIQTFIALLFLVCQERIALWQREESTEIYVASGAGRGPEA